MTTNIHLDGILQGPNGVMAGNIPDGAYIHNKQQLGLHPKNVPFQENLQKKLQINVCFC